MRKLAILTFQTLDGVMQAPSLPEEDFSGDFTQGGWANECWAEVMKQVGCEAIWTFPVVVGSGKRLFADGAVPARLKLTKFETCPCGAFMNFWRPTQSIAP